MKVDRRLFTLLSFPLLIVISTLAQQPSTQQYAPQPVQAQLNNKDVLDMQNAGLGADVIIAKIKSSPCNFDTSPATLEELRGAKVPNEVILAMVEAPAANDAMHSNNQQSGESKNPLEHPRSYIGLSIVNAASPSHGVLVRHVAPDGPAAHGGIREGDVLEAVDGQPIANLKDYQEKFHPLNPGTQVTLKILREGQESNVTATTAPSSPELVTVVKSIAYKSLPYYSKTVYQVSPGSSSTTCNGTTYGNIDATAQPNYAGGANINGTVNSNSTTNCNTTYRQPQQGEINSRTVYNYNVVEGGGYRFVVLCTASVLWSKCASLIPGGSFAAEVKGSQMWVTAYKNGNEKKPERVKYDILQVAYTD
jgi:hypothetical protein